MTRVGSKSLLGVAALCSALMAALPAQATITGYSACTGAVACEVTTTPPSPILQNPNNGVLLGWNELQNVTLTQDLRVDRVFDAGAPFVVALPGGDFLIKAGTVVSSHYFQWDPEGSIGTVNATLDFDSQIFAFITADQNLFDSDGVLGLPGLDYADFGLRGLEAGDTTDFTGSSVAIDWTASSPGDWTRLITAFSPAAALPEPGGAALLGLGLLCAATLRRRRTP